MKRAQMKQAMKKQAMNHAARSGSAFQFLTSAMTAGVIAVGALGTASIAHARGDAPDGSQAQTTQVPGYWRIALGDTVVTALFDGPIHIPAAKLKGMGAADIDRALASMFVPRNKTGVQTAVNGFVVNQAGRLTLIDAGAAKCFGPALGNLQDNMRAAGIDPAQIDHVVLTHLHPDHTCGITTATGTMAYPNADIHAAKKDADHWLDEAVAAKAPAAAQGSFKFARDAVAPYKAAGRFKTFDDGASPVQGIASIASHGHTPGHTSYLITSGDARMMIWGDIVHSHSMQFARPEIAMEFDTDSKAAIASRKRLFAQAASQKLWVAGAHLPFPGIGHVVTAGRTWRWVPAEYGPVELTRPGQVK